MMSKCLTHRVVLNVVAMLLMVVLVRAEIPRKNYKKKMIRIAGTRPKMNKITVWKYVCMYVCGCVFWSIYGCHGLHG
jgi:hypothetical protein